MVIAKMLEDIYDLDKKNSIIHGDDFSFQTIAALVSIDELLYFVKIKILFHHSQKKT
jgi:hypothetical protein